MLTFSDTIGSEVYICDQIITERNRFMNSIMKEHYGILEMYQALRNQLMDILDDADLTHQPGPNTMMLGELCKEIGETQYAYIQSFKTFQMDFAFSTKEADIATRVAKLKAWYADLDAELQETISNLSQEDVDTTVVVRGPDFKLPIQINLMVYQEALLIFYGKVSIYLRTLGKEMPQQWQEWIG